MITVEIIDGDSTVEVLNQKTQIIEVDSGFTQNIYNTTGTTIDDGAPRSDAVYSSEKVEERFDEEIGDEELNFSVLFRNQISQGN
ncbi:MAG: hypothetical protein V7776_04960 [Halopseudomonas aestusnigri]